MFVIQSTFRKQLETIFFVITALQLSATYHNFWNLWWSIGAQNIENVVRDANANMTQLA